MRKQAPPPSPPAHAICPRTKPLCRPRTHDHTCTLKHRDPRRKMRVFARHAPRSGLRRHNANAHHLLLVMLHRTCMCGCVQQHGNRAVARADTWWECVQCVRAAHPAHTSCGSPLALWANRWWLRVASHALPSASTSWAGRAITNVAVTTPTQLGASAHRHVSTGAVAPAALLRAHCALPGRHGTCHVVLEYLDSFARGSLKADANAVCVWNMDGKARWGGTVQASWVGGTL